MLDEVNRLVSQLGRVTTNTDAAVSMNSQLTVLQDLLRIFKGFKNGLVYGVRIRLPHALIMTLLFRIWEKVRIIGKLTRQHAWNLARFVAIYKTILIILRRLAGTEQTWHSFISGCVGGYTIFSDNNSIVLYLLSRVLTGSIKLIHQQCYSANLAWDWLSQQGFSITATLVWGLVMFLFKGHRHLLQSSLQASMQYLYNDSDSWTSLWNLLVRNK